MINIDIKLFERENNVKLSNKGFTNLFEDRSAQKSVQSKSVPKLKKKYSDSTLNVGLGKRINLEVDTPRQPRVDYKKAAVDIETFKRVGAMLLNRKSSNKK